MKTILFLVANLFSLILFSQDTTKANILDSIVIIGVRGDYKTPISQTTVKRELIQKTYQGQELPILLDKTVSVTSQSDGGQPQGYTYFRLRGIDQTRINMTLNGVPLNEPEDQGVYTSNYPSFINAIHSLQIQRGVGTSTNGVASYGGSINFKSLTGLEKSTEISLGAGSFGTYRFNTSYGSGLINNKFSVFANVGGYISDGYRYKSGGSGSSVFLSGTVYGKNDFLRFTGFSGLSKSEMAWLPVAESDIKIDRRTNYNMVDTSDKFRQTLAQLQYVNNFKNFKFSTTAFYNRLDGKYDYWMNGTRGLDLGSNFYGLISNLQYTNKALKVNTGVSLNGYNRTHTNAGLEGEWAYKNTGYKNEISTFVKVSYDIKKLNLYGDLQYRHSDFKYTGDVKMSTLNWNFVNPKVGAMYTVSSKFNYYVSVGKTSREPTRTNLFGGDDNLIELKSFKPEEVIDYEAGINVKSNKINLQANVYVMDFKNEITPTGEFGANLLPLMVNINSSVRSGVEISSTYTANKGFYTTTTVNYSYNKGFNAGNEFTLLYTPNLIVNQSVGLTLTGDDFNMLLELNGKYQSKSFISVDNVYSTADFAVVGLNVNLNYPHFTISTQLNNMFDANYFTSGGFYLPKQIGYFQAPPSSMYITLKVKL